MRCSNFIPSRKRERLVVLHHGHGGCSFDSTAAPEKDFGMRKALRGLLSDGYSVLAVHMPHNVPGDCRGTQAHRETFEKIALASGSPLQFFLEPVAVSLNYLGTKSAADGFPEYKDFSMMGFSGGGWTTVVYAAIDARIRLSIQVAGSVPLYLRPDRAPGDPEQTVVSFYRMVGYPDLYVLDAYGRGRKHVQILNRRDSCCFGEKQHKELNAGVSYDEAVRTYESQVSHTLAKLAAGTFRVEIDETSSRHMISEHAIEIALSGTRQWGRQEAGGPGNAIAQAADGGERS